MFKTRLFLALLLSTTTCAYADGITVSDAYARSASPNAKSGAAFLVLENTADTDDRLIAASSDAAKRVELHTHVTNSSGVMQMLETERGFVIPANGSHALKRGGDHVMLMGLNAPFKDVPTIDITLTFENAGDVTVAVPVDLER